MLDTKINISNNVYFCKKRSVHFCTHIILIIGMENSCWYGVNVILIVILKDMKPILREKKKYAGQYQVLIATSGIATTVANRHILLHNKGPCCLNPITA